MKHSSMSAFGINKIIKCTKKPAAMCLAAVLMGFLVPGCSAPISYNLNAGNGRRVYTGLEVFLKKKAHRYAGRDAVLVTNHSGVDFSLRRNIDLLRNQGLRVSLVLAPEHGLYGHENEYDRNLYHAPVRLNAVIYNLHHLEGPALRKLLGTAGVVMFDIQDMGMRCYTYVSNLKQVMDAMRGMKTELIVLDRPNPLGFVGVDGPWLKKGFVSRFVSAFPSTFIYNMTMGEAARYYRAFYARDVNLKVIAMKNYRRDMMYHETGLPWVPPSPNLPTYESAVIYAALVMLEGVNISVGRGTTKPFEYFGAPWINPDDLARGLEALGLENFRFRPVYFSPTFSLYSGMRCGGVQVFYVGGRFSPVEVSYRVLSYMKERYPGLRWERRGGRYGVDFLAGTDAFRLGIEEGKPYERFKREMKEDMRAFDRRRKKNLIY